MQIEVTRFTDESELNSEKWVFWFRLDETGCSRNKLHLTSYWQLSRPSKRHKNWQTERSYSYLRRRDATNSLTYDEVIVPPDVLQEARDRVISIATNLPLTEFSR